jgi:hypothetical protein
MCLRLTSIESDKFWFNTWRQQFHDDRLHLFLERLPEVYCRRCSFVTRPIQSGPFDLILVDGAAYRSECVTVSRLLLSRGGIGLVHDYPGYSEADLDGPPDAPGDRRYLTALRIALYQFPFVRPDVESRTTVFAWERPPL